MSFCKASSGNTRRRNKIFATGSNDTPRTTRKWKLALPGDSIAVPMLRSVSFERGLLLYNTGRDEAAEREFRAALAGEPDNARAHAMLAMCLSRQKKYANATAEAQQAVTLPPDWGPGYSALAFVYLARERLKEAAAAIKRAIALDPFRPGHHALLAEILLRQHKWDAALVAADAGLAIDPENTDSLNMRGMALVNLGRRDEASLTISGALHRNPHNATTHTTQGWALLHAGEHKAALEHFREALRINPESQWARAGIVNALKARNVIYRLMLFAAMTWLAHPLFNLMLRFDRFGRHALSHVQRVSSNWVGSLLLIGALLAAVALAMHEKIYLFAGIEVAALSIPTSGVFSCHAGWPRAAMACCWVVLVAVAIAVLIWMVMAQYSGSQSDLDVLHQLMRIYAVGLVASQFLANRLSLVRVKR